MSAVADQLSRLGKREIIFSPIVYPLIMWFLFGEVFSSSWCLGWAALFIVALPVPSI